MAATFASIAAAAPRMWRTFVQATLAATVCGLAAPLLAATAAWAWPWIVPLASHRIAGLRCDATAEGQLKVDSAVPASRDVAKAELRDPWQQMTLLGSGPWQALLRARDEVRRAREQVEAAAGGVGLLPDGRPKRPRAPGGRTFDARPLFQLERLLNRAAEQAEEEDWRRTHGLLISQVAVALDDLSPVALRARVFCMAIMRAAAASEGASRLAAALPAIGQERIRPFLGLQAGNREVSPLIHDAVGRGRLLVAVEALVALPWDDADDQDCYTAKKWEVFQGG